MCSKGLQLLCWRKQGCRVQRLLREHRRTFLDRFRGDGSLHLSHGTEARRNERFRDAPAFARIDDLPLGLGFKVGASPRKVHATDCLIVGDGGIRGDGNITHRFDVMACG